MGLIISRFRRKKTTKEILEELETKIKSIEKDGEYKEQTHKRVIGMIMVNSVGLYVLFALLYYFMYVGKSQYWVHSVMYASPLLVLPLLVIFLRSAISSYYTWTLNKNRVKLTKMRDEKKKILEEVMNTETYKVAKEILDKYGTPEEQSKALKPFTPTVTQSTPQATPIQLRQRQFALQTSTPNKNMNLVPATPGVVFNGPRLRSDQLPRPLPDSNRSALDKVVDYLLKDGPNYRMALICTECFSHNGMAMIEEFDYVSYKCAYCGKLNPARKQRPAAPALTAHRALAYHAAAANDDSSLASSASESEEEKEVANLDGDAGSEGEKESPPTPMEVESKSETDKKQD
ncbi:unnamed protein product [Colias eurytheme]|nr:unnamed protein product [Colias eurytheme]